MTESFLPEDGEAREADRIGAGSVAGEGGSCGLKATFSNLWEGDEDFRWGVSLFHVSYGVGGLRQGVSPVNHRDYFSGLDQFAKSRQVFPIDVGDQEFELLPQEGRPQESLEHSD
jgi:hypothetical protein